MVTKCLVQPPYPGLVGAGPVLGQCLGERDQVKVLVVDRDPNRLGLFGHLVKGAKRVFERGTHDEFYDWSDPFSGTQTAG